MPQPDNCGEGTSASCPIVVSEVLTGQELLTSFSRQVVNDSADYVLSVDHSNQEVGSLDAVFACPKPHLEVCKKF